MRLFENATIRPRSDDGRLEIVAVSAHSFPCRRIGSGSACRGCQLKIASSHQNSEVALLTVSLTDSTADTGIVTPTTAAAPSSLPAPDASAVLAAIQESLEDSKAEDIVTIDITGRSSLADAMIIASGRSQRHVGAIADHLEKKLHEIGVKKLRVEGLPHCDWVLVDAGDAMVHLFRPEVRTFYNLEKMWEQEIPTPKSVGRTIVRGPAKG